MDPQTTPARALGLRAVLLLSASLCAWAVPEPVGAQGGPQITTAEPEGFSELSSDRTLLVDIYYGGVRRGEAMVTITPDTVSFADPGAVLGLLPALVDGNNLERVLASQPLAANAALVCTPAADKSHCGRLAPETIGVILDRDRFRVDIFLNPRFISAETPLEDVYIPDPGSGLTMINALGGVVSGTTAERGQFYSLQDQLILARGSRRLRADLSLASGQGFGAERLAVEFDERERRYSGGALWAPGNALVGRQKLLGFGVETQIDTRRDREELLASPIIVFLDRRARVDVMRDGRVLSSALYEAGNQHIDTARFPEGSYEITLRIEEAGQPAREEKRFYTKSRRIPSPGRTDYFAYAGLLVADYDPGSLAPSSRPFVQAGAAHRIAEAWAIDGSMQSTDEVASAELGISYLSRFAQIRASAVAQTTGAVGTVVQISSAGTGPFNFNIDLRRFNVTVPGEALMPWRERPGAAARATNSGEAGIDISYSQVGGIVSYSVANFRVLGTFHYRDDAGEAVRYSIGPVVEWDVFRRGSLKVTLRGDLTATEQGSAGFAGVAVRFAGRRSSLTALAGGRSAPKDRGHPGSGAVGALAGNWGMDTLGGDLSLGAGYDHQPEQKSIMLTSEFQHPLGSLSGDLVDTDRSSGTQYSIGFQTAIAAGAQGVHVAGRTSSDSVIAARVVGANANDRFEVLVDEQVAATIEGPETSLVKLPSYRAYDVRIRSVGDRLLSYDGSPREIGLFPGMVAGLEWAVAPLIIKIGRLVDPAGSPISGASLSAKGAWAQTDDNGYFQIEVPEHVDLDVTLRDGRRYALKLPQGELTFEIARVGAVTCCESSDVRLGMVSPAGPDLEPLNGGGM